jgi:exosome complex component RRP41
MRRTEYVNLAGLRVDGRRPPEIRRLLCQVGVDDTADGSAYVEMGNTKVRVTVSGPHEADNFAHSKHDRAIVTCECTIAPYASAERKLRGPRDKRCLELAATVRKCFEDDNVIMTNLFPRSQFDIRVHAIQDDGGVLPAAINATTAALADAGVPLRDLLVACESGLVDNKLVLTDLSYVECSSGAPKFCVAALARSGKLVLTKVGTMVMRRVVGALRWVGWTLGAACVAAGSVASEWETC